MRGKDSKSGLQDRPALCSCYSTAMKEVYGRHVGVSSKLWDKFRNRELELMRRELGLRQFAISVAKQWRTWVEGKDLKSLPAHVFIGPMAWKRFLELYAMPSIDVHSNAPVAASVLNDETTLAMMVINNCGTVTEAAALGCLNMGSDWQCANSCYSRPRKQVALLACSIVGVECTTFDYQEIGEQLRAKHLRMEQAIQDSRACAMRTA